MTHSRISAVSRVAALLFVIAAGSFSLIAQQTTAGNAVVPTLVQFSGVLTGSNGKPLTSVTGITFSLYAEQEGGAPLWLETQNVQPDKNGNYTVQLGSTTSQGLPASLFASGQARWLGVQAQGQEEQPRIMLMSVPYALKAGDAQTLNGQPASAFLTASSGNAANGNGVINNAITGGGTTDYVPLWLSKTKLGSSKIFQGSAGDLGIGTTTPAANLDVNGTSDIRNTLTLFPSGTSPTLTINGTAFQVSSTGTVTFVSGQTFPGTGTVTSVGSGAGLTGGPITGSGTLSVATGGVTNAMLQNSSLTVNPGGGVTGGGKISLGGSATLGLENCSANQVLEFVSGAWTCTNAAVGTITGVTAGTGLSGGGTSGNVTLNNSGILSVTGGTGISVGSGQNPTIAINTSVVPELNAANTFSASQTVKGNLVATAVGIGTTSPASTLDVEGTAAAGSAPVVWLKNDATIQSGATGNSVDIRFTPDSGGVVGSPNAYIRAQEDGSGQYGTSIQFGTVPDGGYGAAERMRIASNGFVGIGTTAPGYPLDVEGGVPSTGASYAFNVLGANPSYGSGDYGVSGVLATGGVGDISDIGVSGGTGVVGVGGSGANGGYGVVGSGADTYEGEGADGVGGAFTGGDNYYGGDGVDGYAGSGYAGYFKGDVTVTGTLSKGGGSFKIDHPLDPANKYLYHSFVESPDMMNVYNGNVVLDANGEAVVDFPEWFGVLNRDFRYQLTCIGGFAPVYVAEKISNNHFKIAGGKPGLEVSWQVTGIRQDAWANAHRIPVEEEKEARLKGFYIHPELYGAPPEKQIEWARHPQMMQRMKDARMKQRQANAQSSASAHAETLGTRAETLPLTEPLVPRHSLAAPHPAQTQPVEQKLIPPQKPSTQEPAARFAP